MKLEWIDRSDDVMPLMLRLVADGELTPCWVGFSRRDEHYVAYHGGDGLARFVGIDAAKEWLEQRVLKEKAEVK